MDAAALVGEAAARFIEGDDERFVECFSETVLVYGEPELAREPAVSSRAGLRAFVARVRAGTPGLSVRLPVIAEYGGGIVAEAIIVTDDVWRLTFAACCGPELIEQVRAFRDRTAAEAWLDS